MGDLTGIENINPLILAFIGDSIYGLLVKQDLASSKPMPLGDLHKTTAEILSCEAQAKVAEVLLTVLNDKESYIYRRARNAHIKHVPKHASSADYHKATALEAVFGYLFLSKQKERIEELFEFVKSQNDIK